MFRIVRSFGKLVTVLEEDGRFIVRGSMGRKLGDYGDLEAAIERAKVIVEDLIDFPISPNTFKD